MRSFFDGWYFKQEGAEDTLCLIAARHRARGGELCGSVQVLSGNGSATFFYPGQDVCWAHPKRGEIRIGPNRFCARGLRLSLRGEGQRIEGELAFSAPVAPAYDIMGPFACVPFLECRHRVLTLCHKASGQVLWNGRAFVFAGSPAYAEGDCGHSFPRRYLWTHATLPGGCLMLSVADVPTLLGAFRGVAGFVYLDGKELRIATYLGARVLSLDAGGALIRQRNLTLTVSAEKKGQAHALLAPTRGGMTRRVGESPRTSVRIRLVCGERVLLDEVCQSASIESGE